MTDRFAELLGSTQGEHPSPEFVASLRERITAERAALTPEVVDVEFRPNRENTMNKSTVRLALIAAIALIVVGLAFLLNGDDETDNIIIDSSTTIDPSPSTTLPAATTTSAAVATTAAVVTDEARSVIEAHLVARTAADVEATLTADAYASVRSTSGFGIASAEQLDDELAAFDILGMVYSLGACEAVPGSIRCDLTLESNLTQATGEGPIERVATFILDGDRLSVVPSLPQHSLDLRQFAESVGPDFEASYAAVCPANFELPSDCAQFIMDNLEDWVAWEQEQ